MAVTGHHAFVAGGISARWVYGGIVGRFMSSFWFDVFIRDCGFTTCFLHADTNARRPLDQAQAAIKRKALSNGEPSLPIHGSKESRFYRPIDQTYKRMLTWSMAHRWVIVVACAIVIVSIVPLFMLVGKNFLPVDDQSQFELNVRAPEGYTLAATSALAERISADVRKLPGVTDT